MDRGQRDGQRTEGERGEGREEQVQVFTKGVNPNGAPFPPHAPSLPVCTPSSRYRERFLALLALGDVLSSAHTLSLIIILSSSMSAIFCWKLQEDQSLQQIIPGTPALQMLLGNIGRVRPVLNLTGGLLLLLLLCNPVVYQARPLLLWGK